MKNYSEPFSRQHFNYAKVLRQAQQSVRSMRLMQSDPAIARVFSEKNVTFRLRIYFLGGVTPEAAADLETIGFEVFGLRCAGMRCA